MDWNLWCCHCGAKPPNKYSTKIYHKKDCLVLKVGNTGEEMKNHQVLYIPLNILEKIVEEAKKQTTNQNKVCVRIQQDYENKSNIISETIEEYETEDTR